MISLENTKSFGRKTRKKLAMSFVGTTAILVPSSVIQSVADTAINEFAGFVSRTFGIGNVMDSIGLHILNMDNLTAMTNAKSWGGKMGMALMMYGGFGLAYAELRNVSRNYFGLSNPQDMKTEKKLQRHDFWLTLAYSSAMLIAGYNLFGEHDWRKIVCATAISGFTQPIRGPLVGYAMDCYYDFFGFKECNRPTYPKFLKNLGRKAKYGVAALGVAASLGMMGAWYSLTPAEWSNPNRLAERQHARAAHYQSLDDAVAK